MNAKKAVKSLLRGLIINKAALLRVATALIACYIDRLAHARQTGTIIIVPIIIIAA
jgi:hypothetical protein